MRCLSIPVLCEWHRVVSQSFWTLQGHVKVNAASVELTYVIIDTGSFSSLYVSKADAIVGTSVIVVPST